MIVHRLPYWPVGPSEVSDEAWSFACHLNDLHARSRYFDRVWARLQWLHPSQAGFIRTDELEAMEERGEAEHPVFDAFAHARWRKTGDDFDLMQYLCDALACVAPDLFDERCSIFGELMGDSGDIWIAPSNPNKSGKLEVAGFLFAVEFAHSIYAKRELELGMLRHGHHLALWRAESQKLGASLGGKRSAATRQANRRADPGEIVCAAEKLLTDGQSERNIAGIIAARFGVTSDHVRKILRKAKMQD